MKDKLLVSCAAHDHVLGLNLEADEGLVYLSLYIGQFYAKQSSFGSRWVERLKMVVTILRGREYLFDDIVLEQEEASQVAEFFAALGAEDAR